MSGGAFDYVYSRLETAAEEIERLAECVEHKQFRLAVIKMAEALKDLEWYFSGDTSDQKPDSMMDIIDTYRQQRGELNND